VKRYEGEHIEVTYNLELDGKRETRATICRCGQSSNQPYCDRSGPCQQWEYEPGRRR
jgi:CDGSH-type Zn-finger protein